MSQISLEQRIGISARQLHFDNGTMQALVAKEVAIVDVGAVEQQAELLKAGAESATERDKASAEILLRSIANFRRLDQPVPPNERSERQMASIESASGYFSRKDLK
jgi:hypothetical protein